MTFEQIGLHTNGESVSRDKIVSKDHFKDSDVSGFLRTHGRFPGSFPTGENTGARRPNRSPSPGCGIQSQLLLQKSLRAKMGIKIDKKGRPTGEKIEEFKF